MREARSGDSAGTLSGWVFKAALYAGVSSAGDVLKTDDVRNMIPKLGCHRLPVKPRLWGLG